MMCRCTRFHADQRRRQLAEELDHTAAPQLPCNDDFADCIDAVNLKDVLGEIDADCGNVHVDGPHGDAFSNDHPLAHSRWPGAGAVHPISFALPASMSGLGGTSTAVSPAIPASPHSRTGPRRLEYSSQGWRGNTVRVAMSDAPPADHSMPAVRPVMHPTPSSRSMCPSAAKVTSTLVSGFASM